MDADVGSFFRRHDSAVNLSTAAGSARDDSHQLAIVEMRLYL
jgi:hypothetical protein